MGLRAIPGRMLQEDQIFLFCFNERKIEGRCTKCKKGTWVLIWKFLQKRMKNGKGDQIQRKENISCKKSKYLFVYFLRPGINIYLFVYFFTFSHKTGLDVSIPPLHLKYFKHLKIRGRVSLNAILRKRKPWCERISKYILWYQMFPILRIKERQRLPTWGTKKKVELEKERG